MHYKRQEQRPTSRCPTWIAGINLPWQWFSLKEPTVWRVLVTLPRLLGVGVLCDEDRVVNMGPSDEDLMNSSLLRQCSWLSSLFCNARGPVIWGYLDVPPGYKNSANVMPQLKVAPVVWHWWNLHWCQTRGVHLNTKWGVHQLQRSFFQCCLAMNAPSQKVGVHMILYY